MPLDDEAVRRIVLSRPIPDELIRDLGKAPLVNHPTHHARRERAMTPVLWETLKLLAAGRSTPYIAESQGCSFAAAADRVRRVLGIFDVGSRMELVVRCYREGIL